ncbi:hypothetical protein AC84_5504 [Escherichia coli 1-392-07_S4_C1]|uniref:Uncharacterized protein n=1 Tax=Escherichia coli 2-460-02_S1_C1 TaxID=1444044 RepID=A0A836N784_ECOLX|nr:hypothetical protein FORC64_4247 [Escherichia coli]KEJ36421.1 hypothetical protein AD31_5898 [Escherichia coli 2-427-07_S4_C3]KEJ68173.1 hypothetical protein AC88_5893 [Escherichia coli 3-267-03_S4_C1]KEN77876.1 hypothetical protein AD40_6206 [Escherichia coli 1-392-07_S4_C3]KEN92115.1 hypothetical protein AC84_5504 [Escherichia coli 1-392-07_S4_C1]KEO21262.1 hypothetical protein AB05_5560 [Escherichia coli 2-460-02_S1_C1]
MKAHLTKFLITERHNVLLLYSCISLTKAAFREVKLQL